MKAMILAAGLGTRLRPVTDTKPKALVEMNGVPLIEQVLTRLIAAGVKEVIVNLHHFPQQIIEFLQAKDNFGIRIEFSHEEKLLDTGGGLKKAGWFFDDGQPFIVHNVDVISDIDLREMIEQHSAKNCLATLAVNRRKSNRYFIFDEENLLCGWKSLTEDKTIEARTPAGKTTDGAFCGIHIISPGIFEKLNEDGAFSIVESYPRLAGETERIMAFQAAGYSYRDVGKS